MIFYNENDLEHFLREKKIVCFGIGNKFDDYLHMMRVRGLSKNIIGLIDNSSSKAGTYKKIDGKTFTITKLEDIYQSIAADKDIVIVITAKKYKQLETQINEMGELAKNYYVILYYGFQNRNEFSAYQSNIYPEYAIGENGENLTISILTHNRVELTLRLLDSIENILTDYQGKVLIGDNCSDADELDLLKRKLNQASFQWKLIEFEKHYPIPIGKNRINEAADTDWILQLDNDVYFTGNPIEKINYDISRLGCQIWGFPYYNMADLNVVNYGSNLEYAEGRENRKYLECRMDLKFERNESLWEPMLCTYTSGGASLMKKDLFLSLGKYDENLYMFEDIDFMYRVNMQGYKVGNIGMNCLVHDHKILDSDSGKKYEEIRYAADREQRSREYFMQKYGFALG